MFYSEKSDLLNISATALLSRLFIITLAKIRSICNQPFDKRTQTYLNASPLNFLNSWDSIHFLEISNNGYNYEHALPFFPLVPLISRVLNIYDNLNRYSYK